MDVSTLAITLDRIRNLVPAVIIILDRCFFSLDILRFLHGYGYIIAAAYSRNEIKHVLSANIRMLDSVNNTIIYNN